MSESDHIRLWHMIDAAYEALVFIRNKQPALPPLIAQLERLLADAE